ncbi:MAG: TetR/AcrR family transcriptional regulator [Actinobacteria bacterium]|nr:TetR/AcrR family transcriptional regulator [Actinomycetota bacterium]
MAPTKAAPGEVRLTGPERRQQLIEAARQVFLRHGLNGARTRHIADEAGVNEALLYHYFPSKEAIFEVAVLEPLHEMMTELFEASMMAESGTVQAQEVRRTVLQVVRTMNEILPLLGMVLFGDQETGRRFYQEKYYPLLRQGYEAGSRAMAGWANRPIDPSVATAVHGMCFVAAMDRWFRGVEPDQEHMADVLTDLVLNWNPAPTVS